MEVAQKIVKAIGVPQFQRFFKFLGKTLTIPANYSGENILEGSQGHACRLLSFKFALFAFQNGV